MLILPSGAYFPHDIARQSCAYFIALQGLLYYSESQYFEVQISDAYGTSEGQAQRNEFADKQSIITEMQLVREKADTRFTIPKAYLARMR